MNKLIILLLVVVLSSCNDEELGGVPCGGNATQKIGAKCKDGTTSSSTGSGTCSSHGGVDYWICKKP